MKKFLSLTFAFALFAVTVPAEAYFYHYLHPTPVQRYVPTGVSEGWPQWIDDGEHSHRSMKKEWDGQVDMKPMEKMYKPSGDKDIISWPDWIDVPYFLR